MPSFVTLGGRESPRQGEVIEQLKAINTMAQSTSPSVSGRIGMIGDRVVKFNTHWHERMFGTGKDQQMIDSCNKLRTTLAELSYQALDPLNSANPSRAAVLEGILKDLGVTNDGQKYTTSSKNLLDRAIVAKVIRTIGDAIGENLKVGERTLMDYKSGGVDTSFYAVATDHLDKEASARMSKEKSTPLTKMNSDQCKDFADILGKSNNVHVKTFFKADLDKTFETAEADLQRSQTTIVGDQKFGGTTAFDSENYRKALKKFFGGNENMLRIFNGLAHQGFLACAIDARLKCIPENSPAWQKLRVGQPFVSPTKQEYKFELIARKDGDYELSITFTRHGDLYPDFGENYGDGWATRLDERKSFERFNAKVIFGQRRSGDENTYVMNTVNTETKEEVPVFYHLKVVSAESEVKYEFLTSMAHEIEASAI